MNQATLIIGGLVALFLAFSLCKTVKKLKSGGCCGCDCGCEDSSKKDKGCCR